MSHDSPPQAVSASTTPNTPLGSAQPAPAASEGAPAKPTGKRASWFGGLGLALALAAFVTAALSPWILNKLEPPPPIEDVAVDAALRMKDRIKAKLQGKKLEAPPPPESGWWHRTLPMMVIGVACAAFVLGFLGFVRHESLRIAGSAIGVGAASIVVMYFLIIAVVILVLVVIAIIWGAVWNG